MGVVEVVNVECGGEVFGVYFVVGSSSGLGVCLCLDLCLELGLELGLESAFLGLHGCLRPFFLVQLLNLVMSFTVFSPHHPPSKAMLHQVMMTTAAHPNHPNQADLPKTEA